MVALATRYVSVRADTRLLRRDLTSGGVAAGKDFARSFKAEATAGLAKLDLKVKVTPDWSGFKNAPNIPGQRTSSPSGVTRAPRVPVQLDPVISAFQADVRRKIAALSKQVALDVPVNAETEQVRADLTAELAKLADKAKVKVGVGAPDRGKFEAELRAMLAKAQAGVKLQLPLDADGAGAATKAVAAAKAVARTAKVPIELDPLTAQFQANVRRDLAGLKRLSAQIPVRPDTDDLRRDLSLRIAVIERGLKIKIPVGSDGKSVIGGLSNDLGALKGVLGGALGLAPQALQALSGGFDAVSGSSTKAASGAAQLGSSLSNLGGPIGTALTIGAVALAITALPAVALAASGAIIALGGALASLPALGVGLGAIVGTLGLGFSGISDHLKTLPKAGGGAAKSLTGVHSATRGLANAQRDLAKATRELDKARKDEIERLDDLGRSLRGAVLDEEDAAVAVAEARTKLAAARATGDVNEIGAADRAYRRSLLTLDEARDKTGDLQQEKAKADRDGVEGSDQVQQALERQRDAVDQLKAAQESLADAQKSGASAGSAALAKLKQLAPSAKEAVDAIKQLKPAFEQVRLSVQEALFKGVGPELKNLAAAWQKPLTDTLTSYAATFNTMFHDLSASVQKPQFISDVSAGAETVRSNLEKIGKVVTGPLTEAFGRLARAAKPFLDALGDKIAGVIKHFADWINEADKSGKLDKFFKDAAEYLKLIWDIAGNVVGIFTDLFGIFFDTKSQGGAKDYLTGLNQQLVEIRDWLKNPENQKKIKEWIEDFGRFVKNMEELAKFVQEKALPALSSLMDFVERVKTKFDEAHDRFKRFKDLVTAPFSFASNMFDSLTDAFRSSLNNIISLFNRLNLGLNISIGGSRIGTAISGIGRKLAAGGIARATPGGIQATIAEGGKDEVVSPVDQMLGYVRAAVTEANAANPGVQGGDTVIQLYMFPGAAEYDRFVIGAAERNKATLAKIVNGGNKRLAYGA